MYFEVSTASQWALFDKAKGVSVRLEVGEFVCAPFQFRHIYARNAATTSSVCVVGPEYARITQCSTYMVRCGEIGGPLFLSKSSGLQTAESRVQACFFGLASASQARNLPAIFLYLS